MTLPFPWARHCAILLNRARLVAEADANPKFDALIVGGGIAGAATFRELTLQGLRCLLVERGDFASGASGALTRVAQGGFRYLEKGEFGLVARAVAERNRFVAAAPHQVRPIRVVLPTETVFGGAPTALARALGRAGGHSLPGAAVLRLAVALYQWSAARPARCRAAGSSSGGSCNGAIPESRRATAPRLTSSKGSSPRPNASPSSPRGRRRRQPAVGGAELRRNLRVRRRRRHRQ